MGSGVDLDVVQDAQDAAFLEACDVDPAADGDVVPVIHAVRRLKGRGALSNRSGRFEPTATVAVDDGWAHDKSSGVDETEPPRPKTTVAVDASRTVIARNQSPTPFRSVHQSLSRV